MKTPRQELRELQAKRTEVESRLRRMGRSQEEIDSICNKLNASVAKSEAAVAKLEFWMASRAVLAVLVAAAAVWCWFQ